MQLAYENSSVVARRGATTLPTAATCDVRQTVGGAFCSISHGSRETLTALGDSLTDNTESAHVRGQAAEALGNHLQLAEPRSRRRHQVGRALHAMLDRPDADLRYWVTFAPGLLRYRPALPALAKLAAEDVRVVNGLTRVCDEAMAAMDWIEGRPPPADAPPRPAPTSGTARQTTRPTTRRHSQRPRPRRHPTVTGRNVRPHGRPARPHPGTHVPSCANA